MMLLGSGKAKGGVRMIRINIPSRLGHETQRLEVLDAQALVSEHLQKGWLASINEKQITNPQQRPDLDEVNLYPPITGG